MVKYDIAIIGTGPAGLEAAITAKIRNKNILLIGSKDLSSKIEKAHTVNNYLGLPGVDGETMHNAFNEHLTQLEIEITDDIVNTVYTMGSYFAIQGHKDMYEASSVIVACGISISKPYPGEIENLGSGVSYCATCDGMMYKGKSAVVIGYSKDNEKEAEFLAETAEKVYYIPMYNDEILFETMSTNRSIDIVTGNRPLSLERNGEMMKLQMDNGYLESDGIFILRDYVTPSQLVPGLTFDKNHVIVDRSMATNIKGLFACGDITGAPYQYIKSAGEGNVAALSAVNYLSELNKS